MQDKRQVLQKESRAFFEQYAKLLPDTIYYKDWKILEPTYSVIESIESIFGTADKNSLCLAEIGIGMGATTYHIAKFLENKGQLHIFDFAESVVPISKMLSIAGFKNIHAHGASFKKMDSYNWNLLHLLQANSTPIFDYVFLDGAHSFPVDGLAFFLVDLLLKKGGYINFDDYHWTHADHIQGAAEKYLNEKQSDDGIGSFMERTLESYTLPQINTKQVALVVDVLVNRTNRYKEVERQRVYQKIA